MKKALGSAPKDLDLRFNKELPCLTPEPLILILKEFIFLYFKAYYNIFIHPSTE